jgi:hypothetical protein
MLNCLSTNPTSDRCTCASDQFFFFLLIKSSHLMIEGKTYIKWPAITVHIADPFFFPFLSTISGLPP